MGKNSRILLTIDVEDWFQVENFKNHIPFSTWQSIDLRVERSTNVILDLLDSVQLSNVNNGGNTPKATFFVLGWIAKRVPDLIKEIDARGHEIASHGFNHNLCTLETEEHLQKDLLSSKELLEDMIGKPVHGYRAPNFSINERILRLIESCGYSYDSSYNSFALNPRYGKVNLFKDTQFNSPTKITPGFSELAISNYKIANQVLPFGGGGYFRLIPHFVFSRVVEKILEKNSYYLIYLHPWEFDPTQPRVERASPLSKFRHYVNIDKTLLKLTKLIEKFRDCAFTTCHEYIKTYPTN